MLTPDDIVARIMQNHEAVLAKFDATEMKTQELSGRMLAVEQKLVRDRSCGPATEITQYGKSLGREIVASDQFQNFIAAGGRGAVRIKAAITSASDSGGAVVAPDHRSEIVAMPRRQLRVRSLIPSTQTTSNLVEYPRQTARTIAPAPVSESVTKPEGDVDFELAEAPVRTIATTLPASKQIMDDAPAMMGFIDTELRWAVDEAEEDQILLGDGTGINLNGLVPQATAYTAPFVVSGATMLDTLLLAIAQVEAQEIPVDSIVLNTLDWRRLQVLKDGDNRYLGAGPFAVPGNFVWGVPVVATNAMTEDEFLVGGLAVSAQLFDRQETVVEFSTEDGDNFKKNMITARCEKRVALAVKRTTGLVTGDFGNVT